MNKIRSWFLKRKAVESEPKDYCVHWEVIGNSGYSRRSLTREEAKQALDASLRERLPMLPAINVLYYIATVQERDEHERKRNT